MKFIPLWMFPLAITVGNTFVLKPSEQDPMTPMLLAELAQEAGLPKGVLNIVHGAALIIISTGLYNQSPARISN